MPNPENRKSIVAIVRCPSYEEQVVFDAVMRGFFLLGGASTFFDKNERILLKPNALSAVDPRLGVTTHPAVFEAVIKVMKETGATLSYGDSPAMYKPMQALEKAGLSAVAEKYGIPLADFENGRKVVHKQARLKGSLFIANGVLDADSLVSISKLKTHGLTRITGAVKNQFGCVPGLNKARYHAQFPLVNDFCALLVDITTFVHPRLYVIDAVMGMEGNGPNSGELKKLGVLIFSTDPVAADAVACKIIDIKPEFIPTCKIGQQAGLGVCDYDKIDIVGDPVADFIDKKFRIPRKPPAFAEGRGLLRKIAGAVMPKPVIDRSLCATCGACIAICPVDPKALSWKGEEQSEPPIYDYQKCIRCFCCQETCPHKAISVQTAMIGKILPAVVTAGMLVGHSKSILRRIAKGIRGKFDK